jgi:hypothetical protein
MPHPIERRSSTAPWIATAVALFFVASGGFAQERWFHVRVIENGDDLDHGGPGRGGPTHVAVNVPLSLLEAALRLLPDQVQRDLDVHLDDAHFDLADLRKFWQDARNTTDATYVTVESPDQTVKVAKQGELLVAKTVERSARGTQVDVRFPFAVLDAMFQGTDEHHVDLVAAARALAQYGDGDIVTVDDGDTNVRVWVDDVNEPAL